MQISREVKEELNKLSFEVFGSTSKWKKMVEKGVPELVQEDTKKMTVKDGKEEFEIVKTPVLHKDQMTQYVLKRYTVDEVKEFMLMAKERKKQVHEMIKRIEQQKRDEEIAKKTVAEQASGSSI